MNSEPLMRSDSVVLVSGGGRGITAQCVIRLAEHSQGKYILLGRSSIEDGEPEWAKGIDEEADLKRRIMEVLQNEGQKPLPAKIQALFRHITAVREIESTLNAIRLAGAEVEYVSADVTNVENLVQNLAGPISRMGSVTGIIHGAGNLADKRIEKKTEADFATVFEPKINGLENMLKIVPAAQLDFLVLFSSIVGFYGNAGQSDYAMANEVLNKTALQLQQHYPDCKVLSINWGPWEAGMVTPELKRAFEAQGIEVIPVDVGTKILVEELTGHRSDAVQVVVGTQPIYPMSEFEPRLNQYQIHRHITLEANPFLYDHMIGEHPVLPATCAATWIVNACEQLYPGYTFFTIEKYKVLKGIVFDETLADEYTLDLKETSKSPEGVIDFDALIWSKGPKGRPLYHYSLSVRLIRTMPEAPHQDVLELNFPTGTETISGKSLYLDGTLFHGPSFQGVESVLHVSEGKLVMRCILPEVDPAYQGQFPVQTSNPYIYDAIVQCLLIWAQYFYQAPCLPSRMDRLEQYRAIPFDQPCIVTMEVQSQSATSVIGNIMVTDEQGKAYVRITRLEGTISPLLKRLISTPKGMNGK